MRYVDTSVLVAYLTPEAYSAQAIEIFCDPKNHPLAISLWTETEFFSALCIKCRTNQLTEAQSLLVQEQYTSLKAQFIWLPITDNEYLTASNLLKHWQTGLRAGDALHLAIALKTELINHESYPTRETARKSIFDYIEVFYNRQRLHSSNGYLSPVDYEMQLKAA